MRTFSLELISSLQKVDLRLNTLRERMEHLEHFSVQVHMNTRNMSVCSRWASRDCESIDVSVDVTLCVYVCVFRRWMLFGRRWRRR